MAYGDQTNRKRWIWFLAVLGIIVIIIAAVLLAGDPEPAERKAQPPDAREVAGSFMKAMLVADGPSSYDLMSERLQSQIGILATWDTFLDATFEEGEEGVTEIETNEIQNSGTPKPVRIVYDIDITEEISQQIELVLRDIDGSWKVDEFISTDGP